MTQFVVVLHDYEDKPSYEEKPSFLKGYHTINEQLSYSLTLEHAMTFSSATEIIQFLMSVCEKRPITEKLSIHKVSFGNLILGEKV